MSVPRAACRILAVLLLLGTNPGLSAQQRGDTMRVVVPPKALSFIAMGDWGRQGEYHQRDVARQMGLTAKQLDIDFVLALGDNFYPNGVQSVTDPQWRTSFEDIYTAHALNVEWFVVLGNHDYRGNPEAQLQYSAVSRRWRLPARYYSFTRQVADGVTAQFLVIDTSPFIKDYRREPDRYAVAGTDTVAQRRWLDSTLAASTAQWKFIVGHHNIYSGGKRPILEDIAAFVNPRLAKYGVTAYLSGHEHQLEHIVPAGSTTNYLISGAGSETRPAAGMAGTKFVASRSGFMVLSIGADATIVQAIDYTGRLLYRTAIRNPRP